MCNFTQSYHSEAGFRSFFINILDFFSLNAHLITVLLFLGGQISTWIFFAYLYLALYFNFSSLTSHYTVFTPIWLFVSLLLFKNVKLVHPYVRVTVRVLHVQLICCQSLSFCGLLLNLPVKQSHFELWCWNILSLQSRTLHGTLNVLRGGVGVFRSSRDKVSCGVWVQECRRAWRWRTRISNVVFCNF